MNAMTLAVAAGMPGQLNFSWVPEPTPFEVARALEKRAAVKAARFARRVARKAAELARAAGKQHGPHQVDWLNPRDFAIEQLAEHAGRFPPELSSVFFDEIASRVKQMLKACATKQKDRKKTRRTSVAWRKVYYKLVIAPKQHGDPELVAVERGDTRPECASLTDDTGADLDPTAVGADVLANDPLAVLLADERDGADDDREDGGPMRPDPATANSKRTAQRWRAEERSLLAMLARSAARCAELAGRVTARAAESVA
ncbi:MAG TPA: hypothetical protein VF292_08265 [Rhodanobacteraceae bacterium]